VRAHAALGRRLAASRPRACSRTTATSRRISGRQGGFPASQDADHSPIDDGDYWTWTRAELRDALQDDDLLQVAVAWYGHDDPGASMHVDSSRRVLFQALSLDDLAQQLGVDNDTAEWRVQAVRQRLKATRDARPRPYVDTTLYSGWTSLVASGFLAAARHLDHDDARGDALRALRRVWRDGFREGTGLLHRVGDDTSGVHLDDHAHAMLAFLDAFEVTQDPTWLADARLIGETMLQRFGDASGGGLLDRAADEPGVVAALDRPYLPVADAPAPSGNGSAALALLRLHALTGDAAPREHALAILRAFGGSAHRLGSSAATYVKATTWALLPVTTVVVVEDGAGGRQLLRAALRSYRPRTVVRRYDPDTVDPATLPPELRAMITGDAPRAYVCAGRTCAAPVADPDRLAEVLRTLRG
jgi:uncharacterized protein